MTEIVLFNLTSKSHNRKKKYVLDIKNRAIIDENKLILLCLVKTIYESYIITAIKT